MRIKKVSIETLKPDDKNARQHNDANLKAVKRSLEKYGQQKPIVITDEMKVIAGNCTVDAAKELGWTEVSCVVTTLEEEERIGYAIADNRTTDLSHWHGDVLKMLVEQYDIDITDIGFDADSFEIAIGESDWGEIDLPALDEEVGSPSVNVMLIVGDVSKKQTVIDAIKTMLEEKKWDFVKVKD